jgi:hypothetical protein
MEKSFTEGLIAGLERAKAKALEELGRGDECEACDEPIDGFGLCGECKVVAGESACVCLTVSRIPRMREQAGFHIKMEDDGTSTIIERCPSYWNGKEVRTKVYLEKRRRLGSKMRDAGWYDKITTYAIDARNPHQLAPTVEYQPARGHEAPRGGYV